MGQSAELHSFQCARIHQDEAQMGNCKAPSPPSHPPPRKSSCAATDCALSERVMKSIHLHLLEVTCSRQHNSKMLTHSTIMSGENSVNDSYNASTTRQLLDFEQMHVLVLHHAL